FQPHHVAARPTHHQPGARHGHGAPGPRGGRCPPPPARHPRRRRAPLRRGAGPGGARAPGSAQRGGPPRPPPRPPDVLPRPPTPPAPRPPVTVCAYAEQIWLPRKVPPLVHASLADTYRSAPRAHILPAMGEVPLIDLTPAHLEDLRALMTRPEKEGGKGLKMKT